MSTTTRLTDNDVQQLARECDARAVDTSRRFSGSLRGPYAAGPDHLRLLTEAELWERLAAACRELAELRADLEALDYA